MSPRYLCAGRLFYSIEEASRHASFIHKISGFIVAIEEVRPT
jgi:hypothetical protein